MIAMIRYSLLVLLLAKGAMAAEDEGYWPDLKSILFEDRILLDGGPYIEAQIPFRAENDLRQVLGAYVTTPDKTPIKRVYFILDENPMPVSLQMTPLQAVGEMRFDGTFRVDRPTNTHIVMELADGRLFVEDNYVKTSGVGACSAAPVNDPEAALATIGQMVLKRDEADAAAALRGEGANLDVQISHPQNSGMQMNQITLLYIPARYITALDILVDGAPWMSVEGSISLAENPELHFNLPQGAASAEVMLTDSEGLKTQAVLGE